MIIIKAEFNFFLFIPARGHHFNLAADVVLPATTFAETQGSYTNLEGRVQFVRPVLRAALPLRESWEVLCDLGQRLGLEDMDYAKAFMKRLGIPTAPFAVASDPIAARAHAQTRAVRAPSMWR